MNKKGSDRSSRAENWIYSRHFSLRNFLFPKQANKYSKYIEICLNIIILNILYIFVFILVYVIIFVVQNDIQ